MPQILVAGVPGFTGEPILVLGNFVHPLWVRRRCPKLHQYGRIDLLQALACWENVVSMLLVLVEHPCHVIEDRHPGRSPEIED